MSRDTYIRQDTNIGKEKSKGAINDIITSFVTNKINHHLGKYLLDIKKEDLQASVGNHSAITLANIQLRKDAFDDLRLPVEVDSSSYVRELKVELKMFPTQVHINVKGVRAKVHPNSNSWEAGQWEDYKIKHLKDWEVSQKNLFENLNMKSYKQRKLNMVANNINVTIEDIIILFEDLSIPGIPCAIRIKLEEFKVATTNHDFTTEKFSGDEVITYRKINIRDLSVAMKKKDGSDDHCEFSERMYIIRPCSAIIKYSQRHKPQDREPVHTLNIFIQSLVLNINDVQRQLIESLSSSMSNKSMNKIYEENRPNIRVHGNEKEWWEFLLKSYRKDMDTNIANLISNRQKMDEYIDLYKSCQPIIHAPWLKEGDKIKEDRLLVLEKELTLKKILQYRTFALFQLRIEAMSYVKARGNVRGRTHLGDLWDYYLNDFESLLGDPYKTVAEEYEIELTSNEKEELNLLLNQDKLNIVDSYLNGTSSSRKDKLLDFSIEIEQISLFIQDSQGDDENLFRTVKKNECLCGRCREKDESNLKSHRQTADPVEEAKKNKFDSQVISVIKVNAEGQSVDPKLVKERTLLVIQTSIQGDFMVYRDMQIETVKKNLNKIHLLGFDIWDPLTLQDQNKNEFFRANYGFNSGAELFDSLLEGKIEDISIINSFRFFLHEFKLMPEFEFLIHYKAIKDVTVSLYNEKNNQFCVCKKKVCSEKEMIEEFFNPLSKNCLHMDESKKIKFATCKLADIFEDLKSWFRNSIMPRFMRNCIRWIPQSSLKQDSKSNHLTLYINWKGKSSPLQVQFNKIKRKENKVEFDKIYNGQKIKVEGKLLELNLTTETVHNLIKWTMKTEDYFITQKSFSSTLSSCHPKIDYIRTLLNNLKKNGKQLYYILYEKKKNSVPEIIFKITTLKINLVETLLTSNPSKILTTEISINNFIYQPESLKKAENQSSIRDPINFINSKIRLGLERDKKFYSSNEIKFISADIICNMTPVMRIQGFKMVFNECMMKAHPFLIESISEMTLHSVSITLCEDLLSFLGLVTTLDFTPIISVSRENHEISELKKIIFKNDKKLLQEQMINLHTQHYINKDIGKCNHCILLNRKLCQTMVFAIGEVNDGSSGIFIKLTNFMNKEDITLHNPFFCGISQEGVFSTKFLMYCTEFIDTTMIKLKLHEDIHLKSHNKKSEPITKDQEDQNNEKTKTYSFNPYLISPLFTVEHKTATNVPTLAVSSSVNSIPFYLLLSIKSRKDWKIFDVKKWEKLDQFYRKYPKMLKKIRKFQGKEEAIEARNQFLNSEDEIDQIIDEKYDTMKLNIHSIEFIAGNQSEITKVFSVIFSLVSFQQLFAKYQQSLLCSKQKKPILLKNIIKFDKILIKCSILNKNGSNALDFSISIQNLLINSLTSQKSSEKVLLSGFDMTEHDFKVRSSFLLRREESTIEKYEKIETLNDCSYVQIDLATITLNEYLLEIDSFFIETESITNQVKGLLSEFSSHKTNIIETCLKTIISIQRVYLKKDSSEFYLVFIPFEPMEDEGRGLVIDQIVTTVDFKQTRMMNLHLMPFYSYMNSESLVDLIKIVKKLFSYLNQIPLIIQIPEKFKFHSLRFLEILPFQLDFDLEKIYLELRKGETHISTVYIEKVSITNESSHEVFDGNLKSFKLLSNTKNYSHVITPLKENKPIIYKFKFTPSQSLIELIFKNCKINLLIKVIEEIIDFISFITKSSSDSSSKEGQKSSVKLTFLKSLVKFPKSSKDPEFISIQFASAQVQTSETNDSYWKLPIDHQPVNKSEKDISLILNSKAKLLNCTEVKIEFSKLSVKHCKYDIGDIEQAKVLVFIPINPLTESFILKNKVNIELTNTKLGLSLYLIKIIEDIVNTNMDEPLEGVEKKFKSKNTKFKISVSDGKINIARWITKPWENMNIVRIVPQSSNQKKSVDVQSEHSGSEHKIEVKSNSSDFGNPFGLADLSNRSLDEPEKESEEHKVNARDTFIQLDSDDFE